MKCVVKVGALCLIASIRLSAAEAAGGQISVTHGGKSVSAVPVDKLPELKFSVNSSGSFKSAYSKQWGKLNHSLMLNAKCFKQGGPKPDPENAGSGSQMTIEYTGSDNSWFNRKSSSPTTADVLRGLSFFTCSSDEAVMLSVGYKREVYTGKLIASGGGWIKETRHEYAGKMLAETVLTLQPPTFAAKLDENAILAAAERDSSVVNPKDPYGESYAQRMARNILRSSNSDQEKVDFGGSAIKGLKADGPPTFAWNFVEGGAEYVVARLPTAFALHGKIAIRTANIPKPEILEADFACTGAAAEARRDLTGSAAFAFTESELTGGKLCKTADGKTGADIAATAKGPISGVKDIIQNKKLTKEEQAAEIAKNLGIEDDGKEEEESPAQKARRQQLKEMGE